MFKNVASQKLTVFAFDATTNLPKTGDAGNITAYYDLDDAGVTVLTDTSATEKDATNAKGYYIFDLAQGETNGDKILFSAKSSTANIVVIAGVVYTTPPNFNLASIDSNGRVDVIKVAGTTQTAKDIGGAVPAAAAGASGGLLISGSNSGTTTLGALTITGATTLTGNVVLSDGLTISAPSTGNRAGLDITGNGSGAAVKLAAGSTGKGIAITTTAGDGLSILPTAGSAIVATGNGTSKHGIIATGGTAGTSDGATFIAGTGGVDFRANQTGNLTGTVATLTTYTGNTPQTGDTYARIGAPAGASVSADVAAVKTDTAAVKIQTDKMTFTVANKIDSNVLAISGTSGSADNLKRSTLGIALGTCDGSCTTTSVSTSALSPAASVADQFKGRIITFDSATTTAALRGQATDITASTNVGVFTVTALTTAPASGDTFVIT